MVLETEMSLVCFWNSFKDAGKLRITTARWLVVASAFQWSVIIKELIFKGRSGPSRSDAMMGHQDQTQHMDLCVLG